MWFAELGTSVFKTTLQDRVFEFTVGWFGVNRLEKLAIGYFKHSDERESIHKIPTLDVAFDVDLIIPDDLDPRIPHKADPLVEPLVISAYVAFQHFVEAYRDSQYLLRRGTPEWHEGRGVFIQAPSYAEFRTYLFYTLTEEDRCFVGSFSDGRSFGVTGNNEQIHTRVAQSLAEGVPLIRSLTLRAWDEYFLGDFRGALIDAATVIEQALIQIVFHHLSVRGVGSPNRITNFTDQISKRLLATVMLGLLGIGDEEWRESVAKTLDERHGLIHRRGRYTKESVARQSRQVFTNPSEVLSVHLDVKPRNRRLASRRRSMSHLSGMPT
jgi:hypothetical protein